MTLTAGPETQVNSHTGGAQKDQRILLLSDGGWVVVWNSDGQDGDSLGVYQQRFDAEGVAVGGEVRVNSYTASGQNLTNAGTSSAQYNNQIIGLSNGGWVVAWTSWDQDGEYAGVYQQAYRADGTRLGGEQRVNIATDLGQQDPILAPLANGGWMVYWSSQERDGTPFGTDRLYHRSYNSNGAATSGEVRISPVHEDDIGEAQLRVATLDGGGLVATWLNAYRTNPPGDVDVYHEAFNASGARIGSGRVNGSVEGIQSGHAVAGLDGGGWVVIWKDGNKLLQRAYGSAGGGGDQTVADTATSNARVTALDGGGWVVVWETGAFQSPALNMRAYGAGGQSLGGASTVFSSTGTPAFHQTVALKGGGWVIAWTHKGSDNDIAAQIYNADGTKNGGAIFLNSTRAGAQYQVKLVALADGGFVATWVSDGQDGDGAGVFQRVYRPEGAGNGDPVAIDDTAALKQFAKSSGNVLTGKGKDSDPDGDALTVTAIEAAKAGTVGKALGGKHGTLTLNADGSYSYVANGAAPIVVGTKAKDVFTYTISDGKGGSDTATLTITVTGSATGDKGANHLVGTKKKDTLKGLAGNDTLDGGDGNDILIGGPGADKLIGGKGNDTASYQDAGKGVTANLKNPGQNKGEAKGDTYKSVENLTGSKKGDTLVGDDGANVLKGLGGNDKLVGGKGNDVLEGGAGKDTLTGGKGADTFVFRAVSESPNKNKGWDVITDFSSKQGDKIDLSAIDAKAGAKKNDAFTFIGNDAFSGKKGELRFDGNKKKTFVYGDVNGDGKADFRIELTGKVALTKDDFAL